MLDFLGDLQRTHMCGALRASDAGSNVVLMGWVNRRRDLGNLIFIDLRDRTGITQVVFNAEADPELHKKAESLRSEYVVAVIGTREAARRQTPSTPTFPPARSKSSPTSCACSTTASRCPSRPPTTTSPTKRCASSTAISTCAAPRCRTTSRCATASRSPSATTSTRRASSRSKRPS